MLISFDKTKACNSCIYRYT